MKTALIIGLGGFFGAICRHGLNEWVGKSSTGFNTGILIVNVVGCLAIGLLLGIDGATGTLGKELRLLMISGFLGAFTTFSTFGYDTVAHFRDGQPGHAVGNIALSVGLGLLAVWIGFLLASLFTGKA